MELINNHLQDAEMRMQFCTLSVGMKTQQLPKLLHLSLHSVYRASHDVGMLLVAITDLLNKKREKGKEEVFNIKNPEINP